MEKINERSKTPASFTSRFGIRPARSEWFRLYRVLAHLSALVGYTDLFFQEFFLPFESFNLVFLKAKIAILCTKGFEIMDLTEYVAITASISIPVF